MSELGHINLRGKVSNPEFVAAVTSVLGQGLPVDANTMTIENHRVFWLGPDEWLIVTANEDFADLLVQLRQALVQQHAAATDVSGGNIVLRLAGQGARDILAKGCTLDFHAETFPVGTCAQSGLAKANVLIGLVDEQPTYEIVVRRSFADYLGLWIQVVATELNVKYSIA